MFATNHIVTDRHTEELMRDGSSIHIPATGAFDHDRLTNRLWETYHPAIVMTKDDIQEPVTDTNIYPNLGFRSVIWRRISKNLLS
jgi:hypothetical protein